MNGQWHLAEYQGVKQVLSRGQTTSHHTENELSVEDAKSLQEALDRQDDEHDDDWNEQLDSLVALIPAAVDKEAEIPDEFMNGVVEDRLSGKQTGWTGTEAIVNTFKMNEEVEKMLKQSWMEDESKASTCPKQAVEAIDIQPVTARLKAIKVRALHSAAGMAIFLRFFFIIYI